MLGEAIESTIHYQLTVDTFNTLYGSVLGEAPRSTICAAIRRALSIPSTGRCWVKLRTFPGCAQKAALSIPSTGRCWVKRRPQAYSSALATLSIPSTGRCWVKRVSGAAFTRTSVTFNTLYGSVLGEAFPSSDELFALMNFQYPLRVGAG